MTRSGESGIAMIMAMFMVLILSLLGSSLMFVARTETLSSLNYKTMSQTRYGAESGLHSAVNHLLWTYVAPGSVADPLANYDMTRSPVRYLNADVVLSSSPNVASNYPVAAVRDAFSAASQGTLNVGIGTVAYTASAKLMSMRQITDAFTGNPITLQTWEITGLGTVGVAGSAGNSTLEVSASLERQDSPVYKYAAFATDNGCDALRFGGNSHTDSYDSSTYGGSGSPVISQSSGNVGTNGNLDEFGSSQINGTLSTPRSGVGACSANNVTALTGALAGVSGGIIELPQAIDYPTPPAPNPLPPTTDQSFSKMGGCPAGAGAFCAASANGSTIHPPSAASVVTLGNISLTANAVVHLSAGIYVVNSLKFGSNAEIVLDGPGPVIFQVAGVGEATPIDLTGGSLTNGTFSPSKLQFIYGGTGTVKLTGGTNSAALIYAPLSTASLTGNADFYGAVVAGKIADLGTAAIHYDRNLMKDALTAGNPMMGSFTWKSY